MRRLAKPGSLRIDLPLEAIAGLCRKWRIRRLEVFGSALRADFGPASDVDFLYTPADDAHWGLRFVTLVNEFREAVGRPVDLLSRIAVERSANPFRKQAIRSTAETIYEA